MTADVPLAGERSPRSAAQPGAASDLVSLAPSAGRTRGRLLAEGTSGGACGGL